MITFNNLSLSGQMTVTDLTPLLMVEYLMVAGGGGGGASAGGAGLTQGGGGGGGGLVNGIVDFPRTGNIIITIGAAGVGGVSTLRGGNGSNSNIYLSSVNAQIIALGGGGGGGYVYTGNVGGSGGGGGGGATGNSSIQFASLGYGVGYNGGNSSPYTGAGNHAGGGGGGAGGFGGNAILGAGGNGGRGFSSNTILAAADIPNANVGYYSNGTGAFTFSIVGLQSSSGGARTTPVSEGSYYFEVLLTTLNPNELLFGLCRSTSTGGYTNVPSIYSLSGAGFGGMSGGTTLGTFANGDILKVAYNSNTNKVWIGRNASWYLDPTSTAGSDIPGIGPLRFIIMSGASAGAGAVGVFRRSTQNTYSAPTGFYPLTVDDQIPVAYPLYIDQGWISASTDYNAVTGGKLHFGGGGGGAGGLGFGGDGGLGGGARGPYLETVALSANARTGGGGAGSGGISGINTSAGGNGGSGAVLLRYSLSSPNSLANATTGNPNVFISNGNVTYVFWQSGSIQFS